jgi:hypothetical protein
MSRARPSERTKIVQISARFWVRPLRASLPFDNTDILIAIGVELKTIDAKDI